MKASSFTAHLRRRSTSGNWIPELDGLRFIAIVSVLLFHLNGQLLHDYTLTIAPRYTYLARFFANGNRGVPLFFIISGFILARPFAQHHLFGEPAPSLRKYFARRVTRLEPPYVLNLILVAIGAVLVQHETWQSVLPHLFASMGYVHNLIYRNPSTINSVAWSLEVEVQFYILAPLLTLLFAVKKASLRRLLTTALIVAIALFQIAAGFGWFGSLTLPGQLQYFLAGLLFADIFLTLMPHWKHDWRWDIVSLAGWPAVFLLGERLIGLWFPFLALLLYVAAFRGVVVYSVLRNAWIAVIGGMCYTIYLWHAVVITVVQRMIGRFSPLLPNDYALRFLTLGVIKTIAVGIVCLPLFLYIERPCMDPKWPQKLLNRLRRRLISAPLAPVTTEKTLTESMVHSGAGDPHLD
jgi:peptidoglycan/LPS O-acetylase OafA/YrhL